VKNIVIRAASGPIFALALAGCGSIGPNTVTTQRIIKMQDTGDQPRPLTTFRPQSQSFQAIE